MDTNQIVSIISSITLPLATALVLITLILLVCQLKLGVNSSFGLIIEISLVIFDLFTDVGIIIIFALHINDKNNAILQSLIIYSSGLLLSILMNIIVYIILLRKERQLNQFKFYNWKNNRKVKPFFVLFSIFIIFDLNIFTIFVSRLGSNCLWSHSPITSISKYVMTIYYI